MDNNNNNTNEKQKEIEKLKEMTSADYYFNSYSHYAIHEEMIKDDVRTKSYRSAIYGSKYIFKGKTVLDIGCGTGILSLFAAKAGAEKVFGIECSEIAIQAQEIVKANNYENIITIIKGKVEEIELPVKTVDIIISEWMGYFLLYESMLDTVLFARDKWLKPGGFLFPDKATMYLAGIEDGDYKDQKINWWNNVYGFDFSCIKKMALLEPLIDNVDPRQLVTTTCPFFTIDINTIKKEDLKFTKPFTFTALRNDNIHAFVAFFDIEFTKAHKPIYFSTSPKSKYTHWKQAIFYLEDLISIVADETITGTLSCTPNAKNPRDLDIDIFYSFAGYYHSLKATQQYRLR